MTSSVLSPVYLLRSYIWQVLKANDPDTWDEAKYGGLIPIVPLAEEPDLQEYSGPRIVYGYVTSPIGTNPARKGGSMSLAIHDHNFRRLTNALTILQTALEREDETARDVNEYTSNFEQFIGITFGYIGLVYIEGGTPEDEEGGRQSALITIRYEYHVDYNVKTKLADFTL